MQLTPLTGTMTPMTDYQQMMAEMQLTPLTGTMTRWTYAPYQKTLDAAYTPHGDDDLGDIAHIFVGLGCSLHPSRGR